MNFEHIIRKDRFWIDLMIHMAKFTIVVVIPMTIWFVVLRQEVAAQGQAIEALERRQTKDADRFGDLKDHLAEDFSAIRQDLGEIKGEIKRIGR